MVLILIVLILMIKRLFSQRGVRGAAAICRPVLNSQPRQLSLVDYSAQARSSLELSAPVMT